MSEGCGSVISNVLAELIKKNRSNLVVNECDYRDEKDGLLHCKAI